MKSNQKIALASLLAFISACSESSNFESKFVDACTESSSLKESVCQCAFEKLEAKYGTEELKEIFISNKIPDGYPEFAFKSTLTCAR